MALFDGETDGRMAPRNRPVVDGRGGCREGADRVRAAGALRRSRTMRHAASGRRSSGARRSAMPPVNVADYDRLTFTARADRPMRISVQLRTLDAGRTLRRWQRSVYLDTVDQEHTGLLRRSRARATAPRSREAAARPGQPDPVRRRHDQHEAGQLGTVLDQERGVSEIGFGLQAQDFRPEDSSPSLSLKPARFSPSESDTPRRRANRMFGVHAASIGESSPPAPIAAHTLSMSQ